MRHLFAVLVAATTGILIFAATFIGVGLLKLNLLVVVLALGPISVALAWPRGTTHAE